MGLALEVGLLADLRVNDEEGYEHLTQQFVLINEALKAEDLPSHNEPVELDRIWSCGMYGYSGLHYLRRIAAHIWNNGKLPGPGDRNVPDDPLILDAICMVNATPFQHLLCHSDSQGYYLPIDFEDVIYPDRKLKIAGEMIGSSYRLLAKCERLAAVLELPLDLDHNDKSVWEAVEHQGAKSKEKWQSYGIESFTCLALVNACRVSIQVGAAIVFH